MRPEQQTRSLVLPQEKRAERAHFVNEARFLTMQPARSLSPSSHSRRRLGNGLTEARSERFFDRIPAAIVHHTNLNEQQMAIAVPLKVELTTHRKLMLEGK